MSSALEIARVLGLNEPTPEQREVIEAPPQGVYRVIAGAGSGKTETMAQRVLWLVANNHVLAHQVLGLTFTRKASGELAHRMTTRLGELAAQGLADETNEFQAPTVSTYNSFAAKLYRDHAVLLGLDPEASVLSEASAWSLARTVVGSSTLDALGSWDISPNELTKVVRVLGQRVAENAVAPGDIEAFAQSFGTLADLPSGGRGAFADVDKWVDSVSSLVPLMELVEEFAKAKRDRGLLEFSDQIALALVLVQNHPHIAQLVTAEHTVVLLDEYQDTSVAQTTLLSTLFGNHPVMAVGDPHQAIYGWRGASSANLADFTTRFGPNPLTFSLSTSWRNGRTILEAANVAAAPLRELPGPPVKTLEPSPKASKQSITSLFAQTVEDEAKQLATWLREELSAPGATRTAAMVLRSRTHQSVFVDALREAGVPVHVLGIGGLLDDPGVADIVCTLRVLANPQAETELVRLLSGARWRLGVADLHALAGTARWLQGRDAHGVALTDDVAERLTRSVAPLDHAGLLDAVSFIATSPSNHHQREKYSPAALERLVDINATLTNLNQQRFGDVSELVVAIEKTLGLDIEVLSHPQRAHASSARETFMDALHSYRSLADNASVLGFVQWLAEAEHRDNLTPRAEKPEDGCVQILTIHGAKGLEWDIVAIPRLVEEELPSKPREVRAWLNRGELPYVFRGDRDSLPHFAWQGATTRKEAMDSQEAFAHEVREHQLAEERRLMYVAVTRAKHRLALSGSWWASQQKPRGPSVFSLELEQAGLIPPLPLAPESDSPPEPSLGEPIAWPRDPLGTRRDAVERAAAMVESALVAPLLERSHSAGVERVLEDLRRHKDGGVQLALSPPVRIPASSLERWISDPYAVLASLARPVPHQPHQAALRGTLFHRFVEQRYDTRLPGSLVSLDDAFDGAGDPLSIEQWQSAFEASEFATMTPVAIEAELHLPIADHLVICKIDAVFATSGGVHIVDWKTGQQPHNDEELAHKALQLAAYRLAWSHWSGVALDDIQASFWFVATQTLVTPENLPGWGELEAQLRQALGD